MMLSNGQFNGQLLKGQFDQNPPNLLIHMSFGSYPCKPLSNPLSTMHKQGVKKMSGGANISSTQSQKCQRLEENDLNESPHNDSKKLT
jgi:hypothetical protein